METVSPRSPTADKASSTEYKNEMLRLHLVALAATKIHLAKIYLFDQEHKSYLGNEDLPKLQWGAVIATIFIIAVILFEVSLGCHHPHCRSSPGLIWWLFHQSGAFGGQAMVREDVIHPFPFSLIEWPPWNPKLPVSLQSFEFLIWQIWVSTTHYLTLKKTTKKKPPYYSTRCAHTVRPLSLKEKHNFQQSQLPQAKGANIQILI